eukprot:scaffold20206_cov34-Tisochrysis_lutea.AAC.5
MAGRGDGRFLTRLQKRRPAVTQSLRPARFQAQLLGIWLGQSRAACAACPSLVGTAGRPGTPPPVRCSRAYAHALQHSKHGSHGRRSGHMRGRRGL